MAWGFGHNGQSFKENRKLLPNKKRWYRGNQTFNFKHKTFSLFKSKEAALKSKAKDEADIAKDLERASKRNAIKRYLKLIIFIISLVIIAYWFSAFSL